MDALSDGLTIEELAREGAVPVRTVRYYIAEGLLPGPGTRGKGTSYSEEHLLRLRLIRRLVDQRVPLAEVRRRLGGLSLADLRALLGQEQRRAADLRRVEETASPREYLGALLARARDARHLGSDAAGAPPPAARSVPFAAPYAPPPSPRPSAAPGQVWRRWTLAPGVELQVEAGAERAQRSLIRRLLAAAGIDPDAGVS